MWKLIKKLARPVRKFVRRITDPVNIFKMKREIDTLYSLLYNLVHDQDSSLDITAMQTQQAFNIQWSQYEKGEYMVAHDPWFKENCVNILCNKETHIKPEWFKGKNILDAGCGSGRWSYTLAKLGANITAVDINQVALDRTQELIKEFDVEKTFINSSLENLPERITAETKFDMVLSWGVVHHTKCFNKSLLNLANLVKNDGVLYLYLYGRESVPYKDDIEIFKERVRYNTLLKDAEKYEFLKRKAWGNKSKIHGQHDHWAPLINRRLDFSDVKAILDDCGFEDVVRTVEYTELFIRAIKGNSKEFNEKWVLSPDNEPLWIKHWD